jgi:hypothetical protein
VPPTATEALPRRHDVDWLRVIAIGFLIIFHVLLSFQAWTDPTGFPRNDQTLDGLVPFVSFLAVWRIPLLFLISGMGVRFAMERRDWRALLKDRTIRILVPYLFGIAVLGPLLGAAMPRIGWEAPYAPNFGHLWFLLNIFLYVLWLVGIFIYLKGSPDNRLLRFFKAVIRRPLGLLLLAVPIMLEAWLSRPEYFSLYIDNVHGWLLGLICFFYGFIFIAVHEEFWPAVRKTRWAALLLAILLFLMRWQVLGFENELRWLTALESMSWILAIVAFGSAFLNRPSKALDYLRPAAYPVYIVHLPIQFSICPFLLPQPMSAYGKLGVLLVGTFALSLLLYEVFLKRLRWIRPLFGIKY